MLYVRYTDSNIFSNSRLSRNALNSAVPIEFGLCGHLRILSLNYNALPGTFSAVVAPPALAFCRMQPNLFDACPADDVLMNYTFMAFQCSVNCMSTKHKKSRGSHVSSHSSFLLAAFTALIVPIILQ